MTQTNRSHNLPGELTFSDSFFFPVSTPEARKEILFGGLLVLFLLPVGWIINLGARLDVVHRLYTGDVPYFRGMRPLDKTFKRGCVSALAISCYLFPAGLFSGLGGWIIYTAGLTVNGVLLFFLGFLAFVLGVFTLPGCMTVYACEENSGVLWKPLTAFRRAWSRRDAYLKAWLIAISAIVLSVFGILLLVLGFFFTSVWAWEVVGYAFTVAMYSETKEIE